MGLHGMGWDIVWALIDINPYSWFKEAKIYFVGRHPSLVQITKIATTVSEIMLKTIITMILFY